MDNYRQLSLFPFMEEDSGKSDDRAPTSVTWNLWHGCRNYVVLYIICVMCFLSYVEDNE